MSRLFLLAVIFILLAGLLTSSRCLAQAAVSNSTSPTPQNAPEVSNPQVPANTPALPSVEEMDQMFKQTPLGKTADEARLHAEWRDLSNSFLNDPDLVAMRAHAEASSTDLEKRKRLRIYYTTYFDRLRARAESQELKDYINARKWEQLGSLAQDRVRPGSTPTPSDTPTPTAAPKAKQKKKHSAAPEPSLPQ